MEMHTGTPCWFELTSTDVEKSFNFYSDLLGWSRQTMDMGPIGNYHFLANQKGTVGAMWSMPEDQKVSGIPSYWATYFWAPDCAALTAKAQTLGAQVVVPPMQAGEHGYMSVIADPTGAAFCLWQAAEGSAEGNFVMNENHSVCWVEVATRDVPAARKFYGDLFGWQYKESPIPGFDGLNYTEISLANTPIGGMMPMTAEWGEIPPHWAIYIMVDDVDATANKAAALGGAICVPPFDAAGVGRIAMVNDPTGAGTYLIRLAR
jgi:uncharacterized protein